MKIRSLFFLAAILFMVANVVSWSQESPGGGGRLRATNSPTIGYYLKTDGTNSYWALVEASSTNSLPAYVITNNQSTPWVSLGAISAPNILYSNIVIVDATNATPSINGTRLTNAIATAPAGSFVRVGSGRYYIPTNQISLLKDRVHIHFESGADVRSGNSGDANPWQLFDDWSGAVTSVISGSGIFYLTNAGGDASLYSVTNPSSRVTMIYDTAKAIGPFPCITHLDGTLFHKAQHVESTGYDAFLGASIFTSNSVVYFEADVVKGFDSILEPGECNAWGKQVFRVKYGEALSGGGGDGFLNIPDNVYVHFDVINLKRSASIYGSGTNQMSQGTGILDGAIIYALPNATKPVIFRAASVYSTSFRLRNCIIYGPTNCDAIDISMDTSSGVTNYFSVENVTIFDGFGATNTIRSTNTQNVGVYGSLNHKKPFSSGVTLSQTGTNEITNLRISGNAVAVNEFFAPGGISIISGNDINLTGGNVIITSGGGLVADQIVPSLATSGRVLMVDGNGVITNVNSASPSTEYVKADGSVGTPAGGSGSTNNPVQAIDYAEIGSVRVTNNLTFADGQFRMATESGLFNIINDVSGAISLSVSTNTDKIIIGTSGMTPSVIVPTAFYSTGPFTNENNTYLPGNAIHSGTNVISGVQRFPTIATNNLLFIGGQSNVIGLGIGANLSVSGGNLTATGGAASTNNAVQSINFAEIGGAIVTNRLMLNIAKTGASIPITDGAGFSIVTNSDITFSFSGTPIHGQQFTLSVSNSAATNLPVGFTTPAFSPQLRSNVTSWTVAASNYVRLPFIYTTNEVDGGIWILENPTGLEYSIEPGANVTFATNGTTISVASTGGAGSSNYVAANFGMLVITNQTLQLATALSAEGTNLIASGTVSSYFTNAVRSSGTTNIVFNNLLDGQTITADLWVTNGTRVIICAAPEVEMPAAWYQSGSIEFVNTNGFSRVQVSRYGVWTNVSVRTPGFEIQPGANITLTTNFATRAISIAAAGGGGGLTTNANQFLGVPLSIKNGAALTNITVRGGLTMLDITDGRLVITDAQAALTNSAVTSTEAGYLSGVSSAIQTQFGNVTNHVTAATNSASVTNWINFRQPASQNLTNLSGTGAITNLFSAGTTSATAYAWVQNGTNTTGGIKTLTAGANITITEAGATNITIASTGGGGSNYVAANFGTLTLTNQLLSLYTNLNVEGTNLVANGTISDRFINAIAQSGATNIVVTNLLDSQTVTIDLWVTNGTPVTLCAAPGVAFPDAWYRVGSAVGINTNGFSRVQVTRVGGWTNITVETPSFTLLPGSGLTFTTNFANRIITFAQVGAASNFVTSAHGSIYVTNGILNTGTFTNSSAAEFNSPVAFNDTVNASGFINASTLTVTNQATVQNVIYRLQTPGITASNLVLSFNTNRYACHGLTNIVLTNLVELVHGSTSADMSVWIQNTNGVDCALVWPAYGAQHGYFFRTNNNNPVLSWAAVTNGRSAVISFTCFGTNIMASITGWP